MQCASALVSRQICTKALYFAKYAESNLLATLESLVSHCFPKPTPEKLNQTHRSLLTSDCHGTGRRKTLKPSTLAKCCIWLFAMSVEGHPYCDSNSLGAKLPWFSLLLARVLRSMVVNSKLCSAFFTYARIDSNLTTCNVNTSEPDSAGLRRESGYEERAESHIDHRERCCDPVGFEG